MASNEHFDLRQIKKSGTAVFKEHLYFDYSEAYL